MIEHHYVEESDQVSRRRQKGWQDTLLSNLWLAIPIGVIGIVVILAVMNRQGSSTNTASSSPSATASPSDTASMQSSDEPQGLVEEFLVTTPGEELPDRPADTELPGESFPDLGREHIPDTEAFTYNSNPPTSGSHSAQWARWGIYNEAPADRQLVHNLEHGGVIISYNPERITGGTLEQLRSQVREFSKTNPRVILTPRQDLDGAIALTAWTRLQTLDSYSPTAIKTFYDMFIGRGPECLKGQCPG